MSTATGKRKQPETAIGRQLYRSLPAVYRERDNADAAEMGDLGGYLDAIGTLLDMIRGTFDQRLADAFPDNPRASASGPLLDAIAEVVEAHPQWTVGEIRDELDTRGFEISSAALARYRGRACQPWLLPYFARLVDVRLVSPEVDGQRDEVANAVRWRQRKGTLAVVEDIAESVGQSEVEVQEGWKRVALTPRIGTPLLPDASFGLTSERDPGRNNPAEAARHPGLPSATVDFRYPSRAIAGVDPANPATETSNLGGEAVHWRQANRHGVPCHPGSFDDVSRRTVDLRSPNWEHGHHHPRRVLLYTPPPAGFFEEDWRTRDTGVVLSDVTLSGGAPHMRENWIVDGVLTVMSGPVELVDCAIDELIIDVADASDAPLLNARGCLFRTIRVTGGLARLEHCTVLEEAHFETLNASDCIFAGPLTLADLPEPSEETSAEEAPVLSCVRYSAIPEAPALLPIYDFGDAVDTNTRAAPVFYRFDVCESVGGDVVKVRRGARFGERGCGVLHPATPESILAGAEDAGEMGAYNAAHYALRARATLDKLADFLPVGITAQLIPDAQLLVAPPRWD